MLDPLALADARQNGRLLAVQVGRNERQDGLADDLGSLVAEKALGTLVPGIDDAIEKGKKLMAAAQG